MSELRSGNTKLIAVIVLVVLAVVALGVSAYLSFGRGGDEGAPKAMGVDELKGAGPPAAGPPDSPMIPVGQ